MELSNTGTEFCVAVTAVLYGVLSSHSLVLCKQDELSELS